jgi:hypothetical protein
MMDRFVAMSLGALVALSPLLAMAQSEAPAEPVQVAQASTTAAPAAPRGSHRRHLRNQGNLSRERARASAEHMRQMRMAPAVPKS